jgi:hypothetical protein
MTEIQIKDRIEKLQNCLVEMPDHPNRVEIETDIRNLENRIEQQDYE